MALLAYFQRHVILEDGFVRLQRGSVAHYIPEHGQGRCEDLDAAGRRSGQDVISRTGPLPTLIERDANVPPLDVLIAEAQHAEQLLRRLPKAA